MDISCPHCGGSPEMTSEPTPKSHPFIRCADCGKIASECDWTTDDFE